MMSVAAAPSHGPAGRAKLVVEEAALVASVDCRSPLGGHVLKSRTLSVPKAARYDGLAHLAVVIDAS
jgi:hypothetical protein